MHYNSSLRIKLIQILTKRSVDDDNTHNLTNVTKLK